MKKSDNCERKKNMRFIKKASINNINELAEVYKEFELHTTRQDFTDENQKERNLDKIKKIYNEKGAIITAIHCPPSKYPTKIDKNYMSWCEVLGDEEEEKLFLSICKFADGIADIYNGEHDDDSKEDDNKTNNKENSMKVIIVLHTGCIIGCCDENTNFECPYNNASTDKENKLLKKLLDFKNIEIAFENITPFFDGENIGKNSGYGYENFILAEKLNKAIESGSESKYSNKLFGVVMDFCHIFATHSLVKQSEDQIDYFNRYMGEIKNDWIKLIRLFHLSKYNENNNSHGGIFDDTDDDHKIIETIHNWCLHNSRTTPITLEVKDSQDTKTGSENFFKIMLEWSKLHTEFKEKIDEELYSFFDDLYQLFSMQISPKTKNDAIKIALDIRSYVLNNQKSGNCLFDFKKDRQEKDIYLLQVQSYIYYMRYCNLGLDLIKKYRNDQDVDISTVLKHYMFHDELGEVKYDGLGSYYNIYWIKNNVNLYRCYDGCKGGNTEESKFKDIIKNCCFHIGSEYKKTQFLSFSKTFGRTMAKYFEPTGVSGDNYNIEIVQNTPINCFYVENKLSRFCSHFYDYCTINCSYIENKPITIQEYQENENGYSNFVIDFSDFYNGRGDGNKEASLKELYEKVNAEWSDRTIGSIYDQEVIMCHDKNIKTLKFKLNALEFIIMMVSYSIILDSKKEVNKQFVSCVVDKVLKDGFENYRRDNVNINDIEEILNTVDFQYERERERENKIKTDNEGFSDFAKSFIPFYEEIKQKEFYNNIINEVREIKSNVSE